MILIQMKLQAPQQRPEILRRQRLLDFFAEHQRHKLLLLCAPAGYGKSTLVTDYAKDTNASICWYSLDEADRSPWVFLRYLTESIRLRFPDFGSHTLHMLETMSGEEDGDSGEQRMDAQLSEVMEALLNDLYETASCRFVVVLDDYHRIDNNSINILMTKFLHYLPENGQIIILSREVPSLVLSQLATQQEIAGLGITELRFTMEETETFLRQHCGQDFSAQEIETQVQHFDGWITGIILGMQALTKQVVKRLSSSNDTTQIFNYLALEVLEQQRKDGQRLQNIFFCEEQELFSILLAFCKQPQGISEEQHERAQWLLHWLRKQESNDSGETIVECYHEHRPALSVQNRTQLQIFALGEPRVYLGDTLIAHWGSAKARELLLYFVASGAPRRKEVVIEALWPEALLPQADWLFRSTLHRLRQAIGQDYIVYQHGLYSLNLTYGYDVRNFRTALAQSQQLEIHHAQKHAQSSEQLLDAYRSAINLYSGDYCEPFYADWCSQWRDELRQQYVGALLRLAQLSWETGLQGESSVLWRRLLSIDKCSEDAHQGLMIYYATNGQRVMVLRQYQNCLEALEEFGMPPSSKTIAVYQEATSPENRVATR